MLFAGQPALLGPDLTLLVVCAIGMYYLFFGDAVQTLWSRQLWFRPLILYCGIATFTLTITAHACFLAAGSENKGLVIVIAPIGLLVWRLAAATAVTFAPRLFGLKSETLTENTGREKIQLASALFAAVLILVGLLISQLSAVHKPVQGLSQAPSIASGKTAKNSSADLSSENEPLSASATKGGTTEILAALGRNDLLFVNPRSIHAETGALGGLIGKHPGDVAGWPGLESAFRQLLGNDHVEFTESISVASDIGAPEGGEFFGTGVGAHSGGDQSACWSVDGRGRVFAAIYSKTPPERTKIYGAMKIEELPPRFLRCVSEIGR